MKTPLPLRINNADAAARFLLKLVMNGEAYHPEDNAHGIVWQGKASQMPTEQERNRLNHLMENIYALPGNENRQKMRFDPCEFILNITSLKPFLKQWLEGFMGLWEQAVESDNDDRIEFLTKQYEAFRKEYLLPSLSADELLAEL